MGGTPQLAVQVTVGVELLPLARKPKLVVPLAPREPLYDTLRAVTVDPDVVCVAFQTWLIC